MYYRPAEDVEPRKLHLILEDMIAYAIANGVIKDDTIAQRDLFDTKKSGYPACLDLRCSQRD